MADDPLNDVLNLEEQFHQDGYKQGYEDGLKAGKIEGRSLGLEKGFEKFSESARLYGKSIIWANRLPQRQGATAATQPYETSGVQPENTSAPKVEDRPGKTNNQQRSLLDLPSNPRLAKHITTLYALVESESLSTENTDEAVNDFDDRIQRAQGKAKIIEKMIGGEAAKDRSHNGPDLKVTSPNLAN